MNGIGTDKQPSGGFTTNGELGKFELKCLQCGGSVVVDDGDSTIGQVGVTVVYGEDAEDKELALAVADGDTAVRLWCKCGNGIVIE